MPPTGRPASGPPGPGSDSTELRAPGTAGPRDRRDRCPGTFRPWEADDGLLVRLRLIGGRLSADTLTALVGVAERYGDGRVRATVRANLQLRALPGEDGTLAPEVVGALEGTGLLPSRTHELVRNVMVSPGSGLWSGRADLRPVAAELDRLLCAAPHRAGLPGRFLFVLDDGRGDLMDRTCDLGLTALDAHRAQIRVGNGWGPVVALDEAAEALVSLIDRFLEHRGDGPSAAWHVSELPAPLTESAPPDPRLPPPAPPLPYGPVPGGGHHVPVHGTGLDRAAADTLTEEIRATGHGTLVVTPWRGVLVPGALVPGGSS
ncbi:nitrite reductase [Nocardiopsis oceani]